MRNDHRMEHTTDREMSFGWMVLTHPLFVVLLSCVLYLQTMLILDHGLAVDKSLSNMFYDFACNAANARDCWLISKENKAYTFFLHDLPVKIFTAVAVFAAGILAAGFFNAHLKSKQLLCLMTLIALAAIPGAVSLMKGATGHFCPGQLAAYGGPAGVPGPLHIRPRCFPAGFPSPALGIIIFYFSPLSLFWRRFGLYTGLGLGSILSMIQIARGEHYLSHCLATLATAIFAGMLVYMFNQYRASRT